jgi:hypothetical protein
MARFIAFLCIVSSTLADDEHPIHSCLNALELGQAIEYQHLKIFSLVTKKMPQQSYMTLDQAMKMGWLNIREIGSGEVNAVEVRNTGAHMVFILTGEIISGAKQDRMLSEDLLLPPHSGWIRAPVYCVEHGRWTRAPAEFTSDALLVPNALRKRASITESQSAVWDEIASCQDRLGIASETRTVRANYVDDRIQKKVDDYVQQFERIPRLSHNTVGVVVTTGDRIICCDIFANNTLLTKLWPKLVKSYAMDAIDSDRATVPEDVVVAFLRSLKNARYISTGTAGLGLLMKIESHGGKGSVLIHTSVVHMDFFPFDGPYDDEGMRLDIRRNSR